jgi:hypothetical protein
MLLKRSDLRRSPTSKTEPTTPVSVLDIEAVPVTRLEVVLDTGLALSFDLEATDTFVKSDTLLHVELGSRGIEIALHRILYTETRPYMLRRPRQPITPEQLAALQ